MQDRHFNSLDFSYVWGFLDDAAGGGGGGRVLGLSKVSEGHGRVDLPPVCLVFPLYLLLQHASVNIQKACYWKMLSSCIQSHSCILNLKPKVWNNVKGIFLYAWQFWLYAPVKFIWSVLQSLCKYKHRTNPVSITKHCILMLADVKSQSRTVSKHSEDLFMCRSVLLVWMERDAW